MPRRESQFVEPAAVADGTGGFRSKSLELGPAGIGEQGGDFSTSNASQV